jgi:hypothetical protein
MDPNGRAGSFEVPADLRDEIPAVGVDLGFEDEDHGRG